MHGRESPEAAQSAPTQSGFSFTTSMRRFCADAVTRISALEHIDLAHVALSFAQARKRTRHGLYASLTPMRFVGGSLTCRRQSRTYTIQRLYDAQGREIFYILTFYLPRFMDLTFREKLITVFHELWHISPGFNGDLRRHAGRCYAHTHSQKQYDAEMDVLARQYLASTPPPSLYEFLHYDFTGLVTQYGRVYGTKVRRPRLVKLV
jgi:predicted metallopeptidase